MNRHRIALRLAAASLCVVLATLIAVYLVRGRSESAVDTEDVAQLRDLTAAPLDGPRVPARLIPLSYAAAGSQVIPLSDAPVSAHLIPLSPVQGVKSSALTSAPEPAPRE